MPKPQIFAHKAVDNGDETPLAGRLESLPVL